MSRLEELRAKYPLEQEKPLDPKPYTCQYRHDTHRWSVMREGRKFFPRAGYEQNEARYLLVQTR